MNFYLKILTLIEFTCLILGVFLPLATIDEFWFFTSEFSVASLSYNLIVNNEYILAIVIIAFGFLFPCLKLFQRLMNPEFINTFPIHKFSMLDIFLLSFLVFGGKLSYFYEVNMQIGFYFMLSSILLSYLYLIIKNKVY